MTTITNTSVTTSDLNATRTATDQELIADFQGANGKNQFTRFGHHNAQNTGHSTTNYWSWATRTNGNYDLAYGTLNSTNTNSAANNVMSVTTDGHVTIPSQPVFSVSRTSSQATGGSYTAIQFQSNSSGTINEGGYWSFANHRFTAPVAGKYEFAWGYGTNAPAGQTVYRSYLYVNGSEYQNSQLRNDSNGSTGYVYAARSQILSLAAADYVELRGRADGSQNFYADVNLRIHMTGRLIG